TNLAAYFEQLLTSATAGQASAPTVTGLTEAVAVAEEPTGTQTMAELVFGEYFAVLTQASLQAAVELLQNYPVSYPETDGPSLVELADGFAGLTAPIRLGRGQRLADL